MFSTYVAYCIHVCYMIIYCILTEMRRIDDDSILFYMKYLYCEIINYSNS